MWARCLPFVLVACGSSPAGSPRFDKLVLDTSFRSEGIAVFDVDRDGKLDLVTDQYWYAGPDFAPHEIRTPETFDPYTQYSHCSSAFGADVNGDGWTDVIVAEFPTEAPIWYENPQGDGHWPVHEIAAAGTTGLENPIYVDLFGDGQRELIMGYQPSNVVAWYAPGSDPTAHWTVHPISPAIFSPAFDFTFYHGLGTGDVDGDGRTDVLTSVGWLQQTADPTQWAFHAASFGDNDCSRMYALDVDGDHLADVICPHPHAYGIHWWQQQPDGSFVEQVIDDSISELHTAVVADLDGDGVPEIVTGKTKYAHTYGMDPGSEDPAVLVYYTLPRLERHDIDDDSGIGREFVVTDIDGDHKPDIVVSNKNGLFLFHR